MSDLQQMAFWLGVAAIFSVIGFGALGLYLSYKFVGPLTRLERWLNEIVEGQQPARLHLRPGDELEPLVEVLNRMLPTSKG